MPDINPKQQLILNPEMRKMIGPRSSAASVEGYQPQGMAPGPDMPQQLLALLALLAEKGGGQQAEAIYRQSVNNPALVDLKQRVVQYLLQQKGVNPSGAGGALSRLLRASTPRQPQTLGNTKVEDLLQ